MKYLVIQNKAELVKLDNILWAVNPNGTQIDIQQGVILQPGTIIGLHKDSPTLNFIDSHLEIDRSSLQTHQNSSEKNPTDNDFFFLQSNQEMLADNSLPGSYTKNSSYNQFHQDTFLESLGDSINSNFEFQGYLSLTYDRSDIVSFKKEDSRIDLAPEYLGSATIKSLEDTTVTIPNAVFYSVIEDSDSNALVIENVQVNHGNIRLSDSGLWEYTPDANFNGDVSFTFDITDGINTLNDNSFILFVVPVNDLPVTAPTHYEINEDAILYFNDQDLLANTSDVDTQTNNDQVVISQVNYDGNDGILQNLGDGEYSFTPAQDFNGSVDFNLTISDGTDFFQGSAHLVINPINDPARVNLISAGGPNILSATIDEDTSITVSQADLLKYVYDVDSNDLVANNIQILTTDNSGQETAKLIDNDDGTFTIIPNTNWNGIINATFEISDGEHTTTGLGRIVVDPVNDVPTVSTSLFTQTDEDQGITLSQAQLLQFSSDIENDTLTADNFSINDNASITQNSDGSITILPDPNYNGMLNLSYQINDGLASTATAALIQVNAVNDAPINIQTLQLTTDEDIPLIITQADLLQYSSDIENDALTASNLQLAGNATVQDNGDGTFTVIPDANWFGSLSFTFEVSDGQATTPSSGSIDVNPVNDAPTHDQTISLSTDEDISLLITQADLLQHSSDPENDALTASNLQVNANATVVDNGDGTFTVTPAGDFHGELIFSFDVTDGQATTASSGSITVNAINDAPEVQQSITLNGVEDTSLTITQADLLQYASDRDGDALTATNLQITGQASLTDNGDGTYTVIPDANFYGDIQLSFDVSDGIVSTANTGVLEIAPVNDAPEFYDTDVNPYRALDGLTVYAAYDFINGSTEDISGSVNGTLSGNVTSTSDSNNTANTALDFDGSDNSFVDLPHLSLSGAFSFSANVRWDDPSSGNFQRIFDLGDGPGTDNNILLTNQGTGNNIWFEMYVDGVGYPVIVANAITPGEWMHVAGTISDDGHIKLYIDGQLAGERITGVNPPNFISENNYLGQSNWNQDDNLDGAIQDIAFFNSELNTSQITILSDHDDHLSTLLTTLDYSGSGDFSASINEDASLTFTEAEIIAKTFDIENDTVSIASLIINPSDVSNATLVDNGDGTWTVTPNADYNGSLAFNIVITDGMDTTDGNLTVNVNSVNDAPAAGSNNFVMDEDTSLIISQADLLAASSDVDGDALSATNLNSTDPNISIQDNGDGTFTVTANEHYNGNNIDLNFDLSDGSSTVSATADLTITPINDAPEFYDSDPYSLLSGLNVYGAYDFLNGSTDDIVGAVDGDLFGNVTTSTDSQGNANAALDFDGSDNSYVDLPDLSLSGAFSFSANVKWDDPTDGNFQRIFDFGSGPGTDNNILLANQSTSNNLWFEMYVDGVGYPVIVADAISPGQWMHVAGTISDDGHIKVYVDGQLVGERITNIDPPDFISNNNYLGQSNWNQDDNLDGSIQDIAFFNDELTLVQVTTLADYDGTLSSLLPGTLNLNYLGLSGGEGDFTATINEDGSLTFTEAEILARAFDVDQDNLSIDSITLNGSDANLINNGDGTWTLTPDADFNGSLDLDITVTDGTLNANGNLVITVAPVNDAPSVSDVNAQVDEDNALVFTIQDLLANSSDIDSSISVSNVSYSGSDGVLTDLGTGQYQFSPNTDFNGIVAIDFTLSDGEFSVDADLNITVNPINDAPTLNTLNLTSLEDQTLTITKADILANAQDIDGDSLSVTQLTLSGSNASLVDNLDGTWTITPTEHFSGSLSLTATVSDGVLAATGNIALAVDAVADPAMITLPDSFFEDFSFPVINGNWHRVDPAQWGWSTDNSNGLIEQGKAFVYGVSGSDNAIIELEGNTGDAGNLYRDLNTAVGSMYEFSFDISNRGGLTPADGAVEVLWEGQVIDTIEPNGVGFVNYSYDLTATTTTPRIELRAVSNNAVGAILDNIRMDFEGFQTLEDNPLLLDLSTSLIDQDGSEVLTTSITGLPLGSIISDGANQVTITDASAAISLDAWQLSTLSILPPHNFNGQIQASINTTTTEISNGDTQTNSEAVIIDVVPINDAPTAVATTYTINEDGQLSFSDADLLANSSDIDGDSLAVHSVNYSGADGALITTSPGQYTFTPTANFNGLLSLSVVITDGSIQQTTSADITVGAINDAPIANDVSFSMNEDGVITLSQAQLLANSSDIDGDNLTVTASYSGSEGSLSDLGNGSYQFTPNSNFSGDIDLDLTITDDNTSNSSNGILSDTATANLSVIALADAPSLLLSGEDPSNNEPPETIADFSGATEGIYFDITNHENQDVGGGQSLDKWDSTSVTGSDFDDVFKFSNIAAGETYTVDGGNGHNIIDLCQFESDQVSIDHGAGIVTIDVDGLGNTATINFTNVDDFEFSTAIFDGTPHGFEIIDDYGWEISGTELSVDSSQGKNAFGIALIDFEGTLDTDYILDAQVNANQISGGWHNGGIVFDYQDPDNYKIVMARVGAQKWSIEHVVNGNKSTVASTSEALQKNVFNEIQLQVEGTVVKLFSGGMEKVSHDFGEALNDGRIGVLNHNAKTDFIISMQPSNWAPSVKDFDLVMQEQDGSLLSANVIDASVDPNDDALSLSNFTQASHGIVFDNGDGTFLYTPNPGYLGADSFTYTISDGVNTSTGVIRVSVQSNSALVINEDSNFNLDLGAMLNDTDGSEYLELSLSDLPTGTVITDGNFTEIYLDDAIDVSQWNHSQLSITPPVNYFGQFTLSVIATAIELSNNDSQSITRTMDVTVINQYDSITENTTSGLQTVENSAITLSLEELTTHIANPDQSNLTLSNINVSNGQFVDNGDNSYSFTPDLNFNGIMQIDFEVSDGKTIITTNQNIEVLDLVTGTEFAEVLSDSDEYDADAIYGLGGNDVITGGAGNDLIEGGSGQDVIAGDADNDRLFGQGDSDNISGGSGNDFIQGGTGDDVLSGGIGEDVYSFVYGDQGTAETPSNDTILEFEIGNDHIDISEYFQNQPEATGEALADVIDLREEDGNTILSLKSDGVHIDQEIEIVNTSITDFYGGSIQGVSESDIIQKMIDDQNLMG